MLFVQLVRRRESSLDGIRDLGLMFFEFGDNGYKLCFLRFWEKWLYVIYSNERKRPIKDLLV